MISLFEHTQGDEVNGSNHSSRRNSSSSGASGGFVKIDDNQVEACGEEQRSMHEYAADVVNHLVLPFHSCTCVTTIKK